MGFEERMMLKDIKADIELIKENLGITQEDEEPEEEPEEETEVNELDVTVSEKDED